MRRLLLAGLACAAAASLPFGALADNKPTEVIVGEAAPISPPMMSREKWQAKPATPGMKLQKIGGIILHHTAVRQNLSATLQSKMRGLQSFSQSPGKVSATHNKPAWPDVPYHFYIDARGQIAEGRDVRFAGDTNTKYNTSGFVQVVIEGDFEKEMPDAAQLASVRDILVWLLLTHDIPTSGISVHKDHASTTCPGRNFMAALPALLAQVAEHRRKVVEEFCQSTPSASRRPVCQSDVPGFRNRAGLLP